MSLFSESKTTMRLAVPLIIGQLSQMMMAVADTLMVGQLGVTELATLTFVNSVFYIPFVFSMGVLTGVSVLSSRARGAADPASARSSCRHGLWMSVAVGLGFFLLALCLLPWLPTLNQPPRVLFMAGGYLTILMVSLIPALASIALKNHADAMDRPWPPFWIFLGGVALNVMLNWIMIFGHWGCPALGMNGAAWATLIARCATLGTLFFWLTRSASLRDWVPQHWLRWPQRRELRAQAKIGFPASLQMLCEVGAFSAAGFLMGQFGELAMASHQIALTCASSAFMIPLGLAMALTVRTGAAAGANDATQLRQVVKSGWVLATACGLFNAALFYGGGQWFALGFTQDPAVISVSVSLLSIVAVFQLFDSVQVASASMLRGLQDARVPALMGFVSYWIIGLPVALLLSRSWDWGARGVWWGLAAGLFVACVTLGPRLYRQVLHHCHRLTTSVSTPDLPHEPS